MAFDHRRYNGEFLAHPGQMPLFKYGVWVRRAEVAEGELYWRVIGVRHLSPEENRSNRNVYIEVLDEQGKRIKTPIIWAGWTWEGIQSHERADPTPLDKPDNEPAGNISVGSNQKVTVWIKGARDGNDTSDRVENLHTGHPDEPLPGGQLWNTLGHHSFYVVFQRTRGGAVVIPPVIEPEEPPTEPDPPIEPGPPAEPLFTAQERAILRQALGILLDKLG